MHKILMNTLLSIFVRGLQNPVCIFHSYNSLFLIHFTVLSSHVRLLAPHWMAQTWGMPSVLLMPDFGQKTRALWGTVIRPARWKYSFSPCPPSESVSSPLTCLVSVSPARNSITIFPFHHWRCPGSDWHFPQTLTGCFICSLHWSRVSPQSHSFPQAAPLSHLPTLVFPLQKKCLTLTHKWNPERHWDPGRGHRDAAQSRSGASLRYSHQQKRAGYCREGTCRAAHAIETVQSDASNNSVQLHLALERVPEIPEDRSLVARYTVTTSLGVQRWTT